MSSTQLKPGDKVRSLNPRVSWQQGIILATSETHPWDCIAGMARVQRYPGDSGAKILIQLLEKVEV